MRDADQSGGEFSVLDAAISRLRSEGLVYKNSPSSNGILFGFAAKDIVGICRIHIAVSANAKHPAIDIGLSALREALKEQESCERNSGNVTRVIENQIEELKSLQNANLLAPHIKDWGLFTR